MILPNCLHQIMLTQQCIHSDVQYVLSCISSSHVIKNVGQQGSGNLGPSLSSVIILIKSN